jgi:large subunit ribosomal protein L25
MEVIAVKGEKREALGKKATKALRNDGRIPCVIYGTGNLVHFSVKPLDVRSVIYTPDFHILKIEVEGVHYSAILKDFQQNPLKDNITHIDFLQIADGHPVKLEIPLRCKGASVGVKSGGKLIQKLRRIKIKAMAENIVNELFIDITTMDLGQSLRVRDVPVPNGIEILNIGSIPAVTIEIPRALRSAAAAADKDTKKKK